MNQTRVLTESDIEQLARADEKQKGVSWQSGLGFVFRLSCSCCRVVESVAFLNTLGRYARKKPVVLCAPRSEVAQTAPSPDIEFLFKKQRQRLAGPVNDSFCSKRTSPPCPRTARSIWRELYRIKGMQCLFVLTCLLVFQRRRLSS